MPPVSLKTGKVSNDAGARRCVVPPAGLEPATCGLHGEAVGAVRMSDARKIEALRSILEDMAASHADDGGDWWDGYRCAVEVVTQTLDTLDGAADDADTVTGHGDVGSRD